MHRPDRARGQGSTQERRCYPSVESGAMKKLQKNIWSTIIAILQKKDPFPKNVSDSCGKITMAEILYMLN